MGNETFSDLEIIGSEYLGFEYKGGEVVDDIRHEDVMALSFDDASIDLVVSNDVLEHVPNTYSALRECARVLSASGVLLATIPFHISKNKSVNRAEIKNDEVNYLLPANITETPYLLMDLWYFTILAGILWICLLKRASIARRAKFMPTTNLATGATGTVQGRSFLGPQNIKKLREGKIKRRYRCA